LAGFDLDICGWAIETEPTIIFDQIVENERVGQFRDIALSTDALRDCQKCAIPSAGIAAFHIKDGSLGCEKRKMRILTSKQLREHTMRVKRHTFGTHDAKTYRVAMATNSSPERLLLRRFDVWNLGQ
jgi:hypothetical protein